MLIRSHNIRSLKVKVKVIYIQTSTKTGTKLAPNCHQTGTKLAPKYRDVEVPVGALGTGMSTDVRGLSEVLMTSQNPWIQ